MSDQWEKLRRAIIDEANAASQMEGKSSMPVDQRAYWEGYRKACKTILGAQRRIEGSPPIPIPTGSVSVSDTE